MHGKIEVAKTGAIAGKGGFFVLSLAVTAWNAGGAAGCLENSATKV